MTNLQTLVDIATSQHGSTHYKHNNERRANISEGAKKRWANTSVRNTSKATETRRKPVMTPQGVFPSRITAAKALDISDQKLDRWLKKYPNDYYYIKKEV